MKTLLAIIGLAITTAAGAQTNLVFTWEPFQADQEIAAVRIYEVTPTGPVTIGTVTDGATMYMIENYAATAIRLFYATSSNAIGESLPSDPIKVPLPATPPSVRVTVNVIVEVR